ncbi:MAG: hypothetical protein ACM3U2_20275, partial [Deltaproteobacteria bacterium]
IAPEGTVAWDPEPVRLSADRALEEEKEATKLKKAVDWLREALTEGNQRARDVLRLAAEFGFSASTIHRARGILRVAIRQEGFSADKNSTWSLNGAHFSEP